ncbi:MAG: guanylate kinase [Syntrophobacteraceae bacterium]
MKSLFQSQLFVVSAPSGVGKTTLLKSVRKTWPEMRYSVSCTTRSPRNGEVPGEDYHFLPREEFLQGVASGRFLEWAEVYGEFYGTDGDRIEEWLQEGRDVLLEIDVQGARQVRCAYPWAHTIFILPPSMDALRVRLEGRGAESPEKRDRRLASARSEIEQAPWYDYIVVNDVLEEAVAELESIVCACHCLRSVRCSRVKDILKDV